MKPDLTMYKGRKVTTVHRRGGANWLIELEGGVLVANMSAQETIPPGDEIVGCVLETVLFSFQDTKLVFVAPNGHTHRVGLAPTFYTIQEPGYGGVVYPQWPEELEEGGIPATPEGGISDKPQAGWAEQEKEMHERAQAKREQEAAKFIREEDGSTA